MLKKISFTPEPAKYDALQWLDRALTKSDLSLNFLRELRKHQIDRLAELFILPLDTILRLEGYKPADIHYLLDAAKLIGLQFGSLPEWYDEAGANNEKARLIRFLHLKLSQVPYSSSLMLNYDQLAYLKEQGVERVYQFLLMNKSELHPGHKFNKKILDSYDIFIESNEQLEDLKITVNPAKN